MFTVFNTLRRFGLCGPEPDQVNEQYEPQLADPIYSQQSSKYPYRTQRGLIEENPDFVSSSPKNNALPPTNTISPQSNPSKMSLIQEGAKNYLANQDLKLSSSQKELSKEVDRAIRVKKVSKKTSKKANKVSSSNN